MQYAWSIWSLLLLVIWAFVYFSLKNKESKKEMLIVSLWTSLFGLTEPIFLYEYWTPSSLFDLNLKTGFDIESVLWSFGVGGIVVVLYEFFFKKGTRPFRFTNGTPPAIVSTYGRFFPYRLSFRFFF